MSRVPSKPRPIARSSELPSDVISGRALVLKPSDPRQADLFERLFSQPATPTMAPTVPAREAWTERNRDGSWSAYLAGFEVASECDCQVDAAYLLSVAISELEDEADRLDRADPP